MTRIVRALRLGGRLTALDVLGVGSQHVARRNAATASAVLLRRREERQQVEAFLAQHLAASSHAAARRVPSRGMRAGTA